MRGGGGGLVGSDVSPYQRWHLINGNLILEMSREEVVVFHELLYNRITQPGAPSPGIPQSEVIELLEDEF